MSHFSYKMYVTYDNYEARQGQGKLVEGLWGKGW